MTPEQIADALGGARRDGNGFVARCPAHDDSRASLALHTGDDGRLLWRCRAGCGQDAVRDALASRGLLNGHARGPVPPRAPGPSAAPVAAPIPDDEPDMRDARMGAPTATWTYRDANERPQYHVARYEIDGAKSIRPWTFDGARWQQKAYPAPRPLYGLDRLARMPDAPVLLTEGEKCADAAHVALGADHVCMTWAGGAAAVNKSDWTPLRNRRVLIWPDRDAPGRQAAADIRRILPQAEVLDVPGDDGYDVSDLIEAEAEAEGAGAVRRFVAECPRVPAPAAQAAQDATDWTMDVEPPDGSTAAPGPRTAPAVIVKVSPLDWGEVKRRGKIPRKWAIEDWLTFDPTLFAGAGGIGKTLLAEQLGIAWAARTGVLGSMERELIGLMWACEDGRAELGNRAIDIAEHHQIDLETIGDKFTIIPRRGLDNTLFAAPYDQPGFTALLGELEQQVNDLHINVLFLDNIAQTYAGRTADAHQVTKFINGIYGCARHDDFAPIIMGHPARAEGSEFSGSAAWENAVRMRWYMGDRLPDEKRNEDEAPDLRVRILAKRKTNYSAKDWRRFTFEAGVLVPEQLDVGSSGVVEMLRQRRARDVLLASMRRLVAMGKTVSDAKGLNYLPKLIGEHKLTEGLSRGELEDAMRGLMNDGKLRHAEVGKYANRNPRYGLVEVSE